MKTSRRNINKILAWIGFSLIIFVTLFPVYWVVRTSFSSPKEIYVQTSNVFPAGFTVNNFKRVLGMFSSEEAVAQGGTATGIDFITALRNSIIVSTLLVVGQTLFSAMAAYAFARLRFWGRSGLFLVSDCHDDSRSYHAHPQFCAST